MNALASLIDGLTNGAARDAFLVVARCLIAAMFIASARDKLRGDAAEIEMIRGLGLPAPERLETLTGLFELAGAAALVLGAGARIAALLLAGFLAFLTLAFLHYWSFQGPPEGRLAMRNAFFGNWAAAGGLLVLFVTGPGSWALLAEL